MQCSATQGARPVAAAQFAERGIQSLSPATQPPRWPTSASWPPQKGPEGSGRYAVRSRWPWRVSPCTNELVKLYGIFVCCDGF